MQKYLNLLIVMLLAAISFSNVEATATCNEPIAVYVEFENNSSSLKCLTASTSTTLLSMKGLSSASLSPSSDYIAYVIQNGSYLSEKTNVMIHTLATEESISVRSGDGHIVTFWTPENHLIIQAYASFPRPVSLVLKPDFLLDYNPETHELIHLDAPIAMYIGYSVATQQYILANTSMGVFYFHPDGTITDINYPYEVKFPIGISVSSDGRLLLYRDCDNVNNSSSCFGIYDFETDSNYDEVLDLVGAEEYGIYSFLVSRSEKYVAILLGDNRTLAIYDLSKREIVYVSELEQYVNGGFIWAGDSDDLIVAYQIDPNNQSLGSNLYKLELPSLKLTQFTNSQTWKTID